MTNLSPVFSKMGVPPLNLKESVGADSLRRMAEKRQRQRNRMYTELDRKQGYPDTTSEVGWSDLTHYSGDAPKGLRGEQNQPNVF